MFKSKFKRQEIESEVPVPEELIEDEYDEPAPKLPQPKRLPMQSLQKEMVTRESLKDDIWSLQEYPTATQPVIYNKNTKETVSIWEALTILLNRTED